VLEVELVVVVDTLAVLAMLLVLGDEEVVVVVTALELALDDAAE
jgi:hypothetical protein